MSNPYQIRTDVLAMAKDIVDRQYDIQMEIFKKTMELYTEDKATAEEAYKKYVPKAMTTEEIKAKAAELYEFVLEKNQD